MCIFTEDMISLQDYRIAIGLHALKCPSIKKMKKYTTNIKKGAFSVHNMIRLFILIVFNKFILTKGTAKLFSWGPKDIWSKKILSNMTLKTLVSLIATAPYCMLDI